MSVNIKSATLYFTDAKSDKVYNLFLAESTGGYVVNFSYGRRGGTLQHGSKTASPVDLAAAEKIFDKLYREKASKGYTEGESGEAYSNTDDAGRVTGMLPQLLNAITLSEAYALMGRSGCFLQEKMDGERAMLLMGADGTLTMSNRKGLSVPVPDSIATLSKALAAAGSDSLILDGEIIGSQFHAFDLLRADSISYESRVFSSRYERLVAVCAELNTLSDGHCPITLVKAYSGADMRVQFDRIKEDNKEGVVIRMDAPYSVGRPNSGGDALKFKFVKHATVRVRRVNAGKRSVGMEVLGNDGVWTDVGNVTIPPNKSVPSVGELVEVMYLYRASDEGSLFQPVFIRARTDVDEDAAVEAQLIVKAAA